MKQTKVLMGMTIAIQVLDENTEKKDLEEVFDFFVTVDNKFSTYKKDSEINKIQRGEIKKENYSREVKEIFLLAEKTKKETNGYFDILTNEKLDPSGIVKGWAIQKASRILAKKGFKNFYVNAGGDVQTSGSNNGTLWKVGIRSPFNPEEVVKIINLSGAAIATSGSYIRGQHIYNPHNLKKKITDIVSISVVGKNIFDADRFATAAFAMGKKGINFIEGLPGFEGYMIDKRGLATYTSGFRQYIL